MKRLASIIFLGSFSVWTILVLHSYSQEEQTNIEDLKKKAPKVFIDCRFCDIDYIRTEIAYVNYVRDRKESDIHILVTTQRTGSGGREYTIAFIGKNEYKDIQDTLKFVSQKTDTDDDIRKGIVRVLKMGLIPYIAKTPLADYISISFKERIEPTAVEDKWNFWVFSVSLNSFLSAEKSRDYISLRGNFSANRVTPDLKVRMGISARYEEDNFEIEEETITSTSESQSFRGLFVKSISEHWSVGAWLSASSSTYSNMKFALSPTPAIEYNFFPYSECTRRQLRFLYRVGPIFNHYKEQTIYLKTSEKLLNQSLSVTLELKEPWGTISTTLEGSHYFHDFSKNRAEIWSRLSLRLFKGLSLNLRGGFSAIHDQLSLPKGEANIEEILLERKELETDYNYYFSLGLSYTFGSVFSNVVNPRFGR